MCSDNTPAVTLCSWDLEAEYLDDDYLTGTVPVLFAEDPVAAETAVRNNPDQLKKDLERLQKMFFLPESVDKLQAIKIIKKPRLGDSSYDWKEANLERLFEAPTVTRKKTGLYILLITDSCNTHCRITIFLIL